MTLLLPLPLVAGRAAWLAPGEDNLGALYGAFAYKFKGGQQPLFYAVAEVDE